VSLAPSIAFDEDHHPVGTVDFDHEAVERAVDGEQGGDADPQSNRELGNLLLLLTGRKAERYFKRGFSLRLLALSWVKYPASHGGKSLSQLAREHHVSVQLLSRYAAEASRIYGERNYSQKTHGTRWRKRSSSTPRLKLGPSR
jgi:hypothetical protein